MKQSILFAFFIALIILLSRDAGAQAITGQKIFEKNCVKCHGHNGKRGFMGAKNLAKSRLETEQAKQIIKNGQRRMPAWKDVLPETDIDKVIVYITTLRE